MKHAPRDAQRHPEETAWYTQRHVDALKERLAQAESLLDEVTPEIHIRSLRYRVMDFLKNTPHTP